MKKIIFILLLSFFPLLLHAKCGYEEQNKLNTLASYVEYDYIQNKDNTFNITLTNIVPFLEVEYNNNIISSTNNQVVIHNLKEGQNLNFKILSSSSSPCLNSFLRSINITLPYINDYYNTELCLGYEKLQVCSSALLNYKVTYDIFVSAKEKYDEQNKEEEEIITKPTETKKQKENIFSPIIKFIKMNYIKIILVAITSIISYSIFNRIYSKKRYGI
ncbi:MAG: hypothetical protein RSB41_00385 [Bacilli bacterium]